ncbi:MAG: flagellar hook-basal body complex protein [Planctomycetales bacterium]
MGLTSAMNTSLNGLQLNETTIDVIGNNIANAGTNGFKASRTLFSTQLARTLSVGSAPTSINGGTNPRQVGLGALNSAIQVDFSQGGITNSTSPSDLAIQGDGFFIVSGADGDLYTRNGNFSLNSQSNLVNSQGLVLQGYGVDSDFNIVNTTLQDLSIPLGTMQVAAATQNVDIKGALFSSGVIGTQGTVLQSAALTDASTSAAITSGSLLFDVREGSTQLFSTPQTLTLTPRKGGANIDPQTLAIDGTTTVQQYMDFIGQAYGIQSGGSIPNDGGTSTQPGVSIVGGKIQIIGNRGTANALDFQSSSLQGSSGAIDFNFTQTQAAVGESTVTKFVVYDSLGQALNVKLTTTLESVGPNSTTFRFYADSNDDSDTNISIGSGTITFDGDGKYVSSTNSTIQIDRNNTAAKSPQTIQLDFSQVSGISTATAGSSIALSSQDGSGPGTLTNFVIDEQGKINGVFDNGIIKTLGQIVLARFSNPQGLQQSGNDTYREGVASGTPRPTLPGSFGAGTVRSGAIELSNTDIGRNLVDLIVASTQYRGNAKVISSVQQLTDELLQLNR